mmetsp:Transcript_23993/g.36853  ORF Transcript_23993/g.36853 Transcript_23993/m.36853 type:complete len:200 (+) Transcript_23993:1107-1706(+)
MHIYPGQNYFNNNVQQFWYSNFTDRFLSILAEHNDPVELITGAHVHRAEFKDPLYEKNSHLNIPEVIGLSVSPIFMNNPGFTGLEFSPDLKMSKLEVHSFQLQYYAMFKHKDVFALLDPLKDFKFDLNVPETMRNYSQVITSLPKYGKLFGFEFGYDKYFRDLLFAYVVIPLYVKLFDHNQEVGDLCSMEYFSNDEQAY